MNEQKLTVEENFQKLIELGIAEIYGNKYRYSSKFSDFAKQVIEHPPSMFKQLKLGRQADSKIIPQLLAIAQSTPTKRNIDNMITAFSLLQLYLENYKIKIDKKFVSDLAFAIYVLNDNEPSLEEIKNWK